MARDPTSGVVRPASTFMFKCLLCSAIAFVVIVVLSFGLAVQPPATAPPLMIPPPAPLPPQLPPPSAAPIISTISASQTMEQITFSLAIGFYRQQILSAAIMAWVIWFIMVGGLAVGTYITFNVDTSRLPFDFLTKGTISNVHQDVTTPRGRLFTATLIISGLLLLVSQYTFYLYRPWAAQAPTNANNPLNAPMLVPPLEKVFRAMWCVLPAVGFMLAAAIPSVSGAKGYESVLTMVHNVSAPIAAVFMLIMETVQLTCGEHAFGFVLSQDNATVMYGPLTTLQRLRVMVLLMGWLSVAVFFGTQGWIVAGPDFPGAADKYPHLFPNKSFAVALLSYGGELFAMVLAPLLPALAGLDMIVEEFSQGSESMYAGTLAHIVLARTGGGFYAF